MRAAVITAPGGPDVLAIQSRPVPAPGTGEILVRVHVSAINRADLLQRMGRYAAPPRVPADIPGLEFAGEITALGPGVTSRAVGDRVCGLVGGGAHAEYLVTHERTVARVPDGMTWAIAGAAPEAGARHGHDRRLRAGSAGMDSRLGDAVDQQSRCGCCT